VASRSGIAPRSAQRSSALARRDMEQTGSPVDRRTGYKAPIERPAEPIHLHEQTFAL
jgi:hypothetical protein